VVAGGMHSVKAWVDDGDDTFEAAEDVLWACWPLKIYWE